MSAEAPSRQALWQRAHRAAGLCILCSRHAVTKNHCAEHIERVRTRDRKRKLWDTVKGRRKGRVLCSGCGGIGHNVRTCTEGNNADLPARGNWQDGRE